MPDLFLIIDMQEGFREKASEALIEPIKKAVKEFSGEKVFAVFNNKEGTLFESQLGWEKFKTMEDRAIMEEVLSLAKQHVVHAGYTVVNEDVLGFLSAYNVKKIYIAGINTDVCVLKAAMDLFDAKKEVYVVKDLCASLHGKDHHVMALDILRRVIGEKHIITSSFLQKA